MFSLAQPQQPSRLTGPADEHKISIRGGALAHQILDFVFVFKTETPNKWNTFSYNIDIVSTVESFACFLSAAMVSFLIYSNLI